MHVGIWSVEYREHFLAISPAVIQVSEPQILIEIIMCVKLRILPHQHSTQVKRADFEVELI